jgi:nucleoside-diphosphate-sugar epimerase
MKVLLTGANGFVGSHILDVLLTRDIRTVLLLRTTGDRRWIQDKLDRIQLQPGSLNDAAALELALKDVTHVIHCAGCTKALDVADFFAVNQGATRALVDAIHQYAPRLDRLIYISSLAAARPATSSAPATEESPSAPVTVYGRSKLAGESELRNRCRVPFSILRPAAVYGPRDADFLNLFKAVRGRVVPMVDRGRQELSLVYVGDLAELVAVTLEHPRGVEGIYHVAEPQSVTSRELAAEIARQMGVQPVYPPLPKALLWSICAAQDLISRISGRPHILSRQKYAELVAPGWVSGTDRLRQELGFVCRTGLREGIERTLDWYRSQHWL